jgi:7-carboxy-7-deazaguanine synthase
MRIAEIYKSLQGEGFLTGTESIFVRASGCNLRCSFCDTPYTSWTPEGRDLALDEILDAVARLACEHVVVTGGEPMLFAELIPLCEQLDRAGHTITIETAGTLYLPVRCHLMSISPKLSNSTPTREKAGAWRERHERSRHVPEVIRQLVAEFPYQFKFVVDQPVDIDEVLAYLAEFPEISRDRVLLMPQGIDAVELQSKATWMQHACQELGVHFCPRMHIEWFGPTRGT